MTTAYGVPTGYTRATGFTVVPGRNGKGERRWVAVNATLHTWVDSTGVPHTKLTRDDRRPVSLPRASYHRAYLEALASKCGPLLTA